MQVQDVVQWPLPRKTRATYSNWMALSMEGMSAGGEGPGAADAVPPPGGVGGTCAAGLLGAPAARVFCVGGAGLAPARCDTLQTEADAVGAVRGRAVQAHDEKSHPAQALLLVATLRERPPI